MTSPHLGVTRSSLSRLCVLANLWLLVVVADATGAAEGRPDILVLAIDELNDWVVGVS